MHVIKERWKEPSQQPTSHRVRYDNDKNYSMLEEYSERHLKLAYKVQFSSVQSFSHVWLIVATPWIAACQASLSITNSWCPPKPMFIQLVMHRTILSSVIPFSSCPQSFPASRSFQMNKLFASGGQSIRASASTSVLSMNTQDWSPLGWTSWISLQSKGLSRVFFNTIVQKHQFFSAQPSSQSNSHIYTWPLEKP